MSNPLPPIWRFDYGDYTGLGFVFQKFLANLNLFTLAIYNILNGGIGFANMQRTIYTTDILATTTTTVSFVNPLAITPSGLSLVQVALTNSPNTPLTNPVTVNNWSFDGKNINVLIVTGLTSGLNYSLSIEVM